MSFTIKTQTYAYSASLKEGLALSQVVSVVTLLTAAKRETLLAGLNIGKLSMADVQSFLQWTDDRQTFCPHYMPLHPALPSPPSPPLPPLGRPPPTPFSQLHMHASIPLILSEVQI